MKQYKMWIDGKWVDAESGKTYPVSTRPQRRRLPSFPWVVKPMSIRLSRLLKKLSPPGRRNPRVNVLGSWARLQRQSRRMLRKWAGWSPSTMAFR